MDLDGVTCIDRRNVLKASGGFVWGTAALGQVGSVCAQDTTSTTSVTLNDQESDGGSIVIASLHTDFDARLYIALLREEDDNHVYKRLDLSAGTSFTDRTLKLDRLIQESKTVSAVIVAGEDYDSIVADDSALIAVGESLAAARFNQTPRDTRGTTGYNTKPGIQMVEKKPDSGFNYPYFLYTPNTPDSAEVSVNNSQQRPLLVEVYTWGDFQNQVKDAHENIQGGLMRTVGDRTNCPVLTAPLPFGVESRFGLRPEVEFTDSRRERVDLQLLAMIEDALSRLNGDTYRVVDQIDFSGGSATGIFIDTFATLHPESVRVFSSGANGIAFLPLATLTDDIPTYSDPERNTIPWPIGVADFEELVGKEFDREAWMEINQYRWIGANDQDPENPDEYVHKAFRSSNEIGEVVSEIFGPLQVDHRFETSRKIYDHLGVPGTFTVFEGTGHVPQNHQFQKIIDYHQQKVVEDFEVIHLVPQKSAEEISVGDSVTVTVTAENPTALASTTTVTFAVGGTTVDTIERELAPTTTSEITFTHTFDEPGTYTLTVNGQQVGDGPVTVVDSTTTAATGHGFGVGATVASVAGLGYLLTNRKDD